MRSTPKVGDFVLYQLTEQDAQSINQRRQDANDKRPATLRIGFQVHVGNHAAEGDIFPMLITKTWGDSPVSAVNGQVFLDGNDLFWVTSVSWSETNKPEPRKFYYAAS